MELREINEAMSSTNPDVAKEVIGKLNSVNRHRAYYLRVIASLLASGHHEAAYRLAEDADIDITPGWATDRALRRFGNAEERNDAAERLRQRFERMKIDIKTVHVAKQRQMGKPGAVSTAYRWRPFRMHRCTSDYTKEPRREPGRLRGRDPGRSPSREWAARVTHTPLRVRDRPVAYPT